MNRSAASALFLALILFANEGFCDFDFVGVPHPNQANDALTTTSQNHPVSPAFDIWGYDPATITLPSTTHFVDSSNSNCTNSGDGSADRPYCNIPSVLGPGTVLEILGGPYPGPSNVSWRGTVDEPIFVHGSGAISGVSENHWALNLQDSQHVILDGITFDGSSIGTGQALGNGAFSVDRSNHITIRNCVVRDYPDPAERTDRPGQSIFYVNSAILNSNFVAITGCRFENIGTFPPSYETGKHIIGGGTNTHFVWITGNTFLDGSEDAIQIRSTGATNTFWFISGNHVERMGENAFDIKTGEHIVLSDNIATDFPDANFANGSGSDGAAIVFNDDDGGPSNSWVINNRLYNIGVGFRMQSSFGTNYVFGNAIWGTRHNCMYIGSGSTPVVQNNSLLECGAGGIRILFSGQSGGLVTGNIVSTVGTDEYHLQLNQTYMEGWASENIFFQPGASAKVSSRVAQDRNLIDVDPMLSSQDEIEKRFALRSGSPGIDLLSQTPSAILSYSQQFGVPIDTDAARQARLLGSSYDAGAFESGSSIAPKPPVLSD